MKNLSKKCENKRKFENILFAFLQPKQSYRLETKNKSPEVIASTVNKVLAQRW